MHLPKVAIIPIPYDRSGIEFIPWFLNIGNVMSQQYDELSRILAIEHRKSDNTVDRLKEAV